MTMLENIRRWVNDLIAAARDILSADTLYWEDLVEWFRSKNHLSQSIENDIAFTMLEQTDQGYRLVQGIFNKATEELVDGRIIECEKIDEEIRDVHDGQELVIYE